MIRRRIGVVGCQIFGVIVLLAGCSSVQTGIAQPAQPDAATGTSLIPPDSESTGVPQVSTPLAVAPLTRDPCALLSAAQLGSIGLTSAVTTQRDQSSVMVGCQWNDASVGTGVQVDVELVTPLRHGLADLYAQRTSAAYWQPLTVAGYPGVLTDTADERPHGTCRLDLGVTNTDVVDLAYQGSSSAQPCTKVQQLAAALVASLKGAS